MSIVLARWADSAHSTLMLKTAGQIVSGALDSAGQAGGYDEVAAIAAHGAGDMSFSDEEWATLAEAYGSPTDAMYEIQLEAQRRISAGAEVQS